MRRRNLSSWLLCTATLLSAVAYAQDRSPVGPAAELRLRIVSSLAGVHSGVPSVIWLEPLAGTPTLPFPSRAHYTLLQKNRMFTPHLQVIPVGSVVQFPNADPFFHNVFSLFDGRRFDLGLYEAGSSKSVTFSREGVSYIFCNIHPEMSAVVLALSTPLYVVADANDSFVLRDIPSGDYRLHFWIEGVPQSILDGLNRDMHFSGRPIDLGEVKAPIARTGTMMHANKFGTTYDSNTKPAY